MKIVAVRRCVVLTSLVAGVASADCEMPSLVRAIPDGATATEAELLAAQADVKAYIAAMDGYIACTNEELTAGGDDAMSEFLYLMTTRIEAAREEVDAVANTFNDQVSAFRVANPTTEQVPVRTPSPDSLPPGAAQPGDADAPR
jgi:hypothetical protein